MTIDAHSREWKAIVAHNQKVIEESVRELIGASIEHERSMYLRGKIDAAREVLELDQDTLKNLIVSPFYI
jgi:hypothetical protein